MKIIYKNTVADVDWTRLKETLAADNFDNGRSPEQLRVSFQNSYAVIVAYDHAQIVGTARALSDSVCNAYVVDVWTHSAYRNQGIGRTMMKLLEEELEGQHIYLFSEEAPAFYKKLGFHEQPTGLGKVKGTWLVNRTD